MPPMMRGPGGAGSPATRTLLHAFLTAAAIVHLPGIAVAQQSWDRVVQRGGFTATSAIVQEELGKSRDASGSVAIQIQGTPDDTLVAAIADLFVPTNRKFVAGSKLEDIVSATCGYRSTHYQGLVLLQNQGRFVEHVLSGLKGEMIALQMPACLVARDYIRYSVQPNESIATIAGSVSRRSYTLEYCAEVNKVNNFNVCALSQAGKLKPDTKILLPKPKDAQTSVVVGQLKSTVPDAEAEALAIWITNAVQNAPATETTNAQQLQIASLTADQTPRAVVPIASCDRTVSPFDLDKLVDVLWRLHQGVKQGKVRLNLSVNVGVIDSGLYDDVRKPFFERMPVTGEGYQVDDNNRPIRNLIAGDTEGTWARSFPLDNSDVTPDKGDYADHGTHIAGLVVGGAALWSELRSRNDFPQPQMAAYIGTYIPQIVPVKIMSATNGAAPKAEPANFALGLRHLVRRSAVINISAVVRGSPSIDDIFDQYKTSGVIFVSAAGNSFKDEFGNGGNSLDTEDINRPILPAMKSGPAEAFFITVGALDSIEFADNLKSEGKPALFSQRGKKYVDLFAPGTCVRSFGTNYPLTEDIAYSGTSQAAPLVSFAAAMLLRFGVRPEKVKARLMETVDASGELANLSISGGHLNLVKALDFRDDIVVLKKSPRGTYRRGEIVYLVNGQEQPPGFVRPLCDTTPKDGGLRSFRRIVGVSDTSLKVVSKLDGGFSYSPCTFDQQVRLRLKPQDGQPVEDFGLADIREVVPRPIWSMK